jgi:hypothetical protein
MRPNVDRPSDKDIEEVLKALASFGQPAAAAIKLINSLTLLVQYQDRNKGIVFEKEFMEMASTRGLLVEPPFDRKHDCIVNRLRVQCKKMAGPTSTLCHTQIKGRDHVGYEKDDWDVLAADHHGVLLIVPIKELILADGVRVRNHIPRDKWMGWQDRWDVFGASIAPKVIRQKSLFGDE